MNDEVKAPEQADDEPPVPEMDWRQVVMNGGPPCFHHEVGDPLFCGRAERWAGHKDGGRDHKFVSLREHIDLEVEGIFQTRDVLRSAVASVSPSVDARAAAEEIARLRMQRTPQDWNAYPPTEGCEDAILAIITKHLSPPSSGPTVNQAIQIVERYRDEHRALQDAERTSDAIYHICATKAAEELLTQLRAAQPEAVEDECSGNNLEPYTIPFAAAQPEPQPSVNQCVEEVKRLRDRETSRQDFFDEGTINWCVMRERVEILDEAINTLESPQSEHVETQDATIVEVIGPNNKVHYRRPWNDADVQEAFNTEGYSVRKYVPAESLQPVAQPARVALTDLEREERNDELNRVRASFPSLADAVRETLDWLDDNFINRPEPLTSNLRAALESLQPSPSLADAIKEVERLRDEWAKIPVGHWQRTADTADEIIAALKGKDNGR